LTTKEIIMKSATLLASLAILAAAISTPLAARDREPNSQPGRQYLTDTRTKGGFDHGMQEIRHSASPNTPGNGWRYFTDPAARRAVVISPQGDYYYSRGKGLRWIAAEQL
jgi:hypothetical protein